MNTLATKKRRVFWQVISLALLVCFPVSGLTPNAFGGLQEPAPQIAPKTFPSDPALIRIPTSLGSIKEAHTGKNAGLVILIQDAHAVPDAQRNIRGLIEYFQANYGLDAVGIEGAHGRLD